MNLAYNTSTNTWLTLTGMPTARCGLGAIALTGAVFAIGGSDVSGNTYNLVEVYHHALDSWSTATSMPTPRANLALAVVKGRIFAIDDQRDAIMPMLILWKQSNNDANSSNDSN